MIGVSTGWMYANGISNISEQEDFLSQAGADGCEIFIKWEKKRLDSIRKGMFSGFSMRNIHLPTYTEEIGLDRYCELVSSLHHTCSPEIMVLHPNNVPLEVFERLSNLKLPIAIENMDHRKKNGKDINELKSICAKYNFKFVLDIQHAYEYDETMLYNQKLLDALDNKLVYCHISGQKGNNFHALVHMSENKCAIISGVKKILEKNKVPLIIEGSYYAVEDLKKEIDFLKQIFHI
jgi:hypothetical protein